MAVAGCAFRDALTNICIQVIQDDGFANYSLKSVPCSRDGYWTGQAVAIPSR